MKEYSSQYRLVKLNTFFITNPNNRRLSLLETLSKVCERVALDQFRKVNVSHHVKMETLNIFINDIMLEAIDKKHVTSLILLDLSKAFDSANHKFFLHQFRTVKVSAVKWFKSYLLDKSQFMSTDLKQSLFQTTWIPMLPIRNFILHFKSKN